MNDEAIDRMLAAETGIEPSSGFAGAVMERVRGEAATPPPIPFPWARALPGLAAWAVVLFFAVMASGSAHGPEIAAGPGLWDRFLSGASIVLAAANRYGAGWIALSLLISLGCVMLSMLLTRGKT